MTFPITLALALSLFKHSSFCFFHCPRQAGNWCRVSSIKLAIYSPLNLTAWHLSSGTPDDVVTSTFRKQRWSGRNSPSSLCDQSVALALITSVIFVLFELRVALRRLAEGVYRVSYKLLDIVFLPMPMFRCIASQAVTSVLLFHYDVLWSGHHCLPELDSVVTAFSLMEH